MSKKTEFIRDMEAGKKWIDTMLKNASRIGIKIDIIAFEVPWIGRGSVAINPTRTAGEILRTTKIIMDSVSDATFLVDDDEIIGDFYKED